MSNQIDLSKLETEIITIPVAWSTEYTSDADVMELELDLQDKHHILTAMQLIKNKSFIHKCRRLLDFIIYDTDRGKASEDIPRCDGMCLRIYKDHMYLYCQSKYDGSVQYESESITLTYENWGKY